MSQHISKWTVRSAGIVKDENESFYKSKATQIVIAPSLMQGTKVMIQSKLFISAKLLI